VVEANARRLEAAGWELASIRSDAPSTGGRSWICDASLLSGRQMHYQAEYAALTSDTDALDALPEWFRANGYETVLSRPSDRERPGVKNANHFHFDRTFFYADLDYRGPPVGWGRIPDQYAIGFLHANVFTGEGPQMSFTHLATSHYPWKVPPPYRSDWRAWQTEEEVLEPRENRTLANELWWVANQFKRDDSRVDRRIDSRQAQVYLATLEHPLRAIVDSMLDTPADRPTLVVILGDHQPPFLAPRNVYDVPMHLAANDPELLEQFLAEGAVPGWIPGETRIQHATFYSWLIRGLAHYDGQARLPPLLVTGVEL
ncbi:MAG: sulfatase-like hydrolase/transferase, partial [Myxococcales bacterium]|nr:sulfatase-like hydrolase/transferase [Myxococcales bacterium]